jgi:hypothetical protein
MLNMSLSHLNLMLLMSLLIYIFGFDSCIKLNPLIHFLLFLEFLYSVNFNARMLLLPSGLLKQVARMYPKLHLIIGW